VVITALGNRLQAGKEPRYVTVTHPGQLSLIPSLGLEMSTGQSAMMRCRWGVKAGLPIPFVDKRVGDR